MTQTIGLQTAGYRADFHLTPVEHPGDLLDVVVELKFSPEVGGRTIGSVPNFVTAAELRRLLRYLEEHVATLLDEPDHASFRFTPTELGFNVQALAGDVVSETEGTFSLLFLVNIGCSAADGTRVYAGAESVIEVEKVREFITALGAALPELVTTQ